MTVRGPCKRPTLSPAFTGTPSVVALPATRTVRLEIAHADKRVVWVEMSPGEAMMLAAQINGAVTWAMQKEGA